jgi:hypothetical protein
MKKLPNGVGPIAAKLLLGAMVLAAPKSSRGQDNKSIDSELDKFNYVIGTQTFGITYQFTKEEPLLETAKVIHDMGSTAIPSGILGSLDCLSRSIRCCSCLALFSEGSSDYFGACSGVADFGDK